MKTAARGAAATGAGRREGASVRHTPRQATGLAEPLVRRKIPKMFLKNRLHQSLLKQKVHWC